MKIYTVKDAEGVIRPKVKLEVPFVSEGVEGGKIVMKDYGLKEMELFLAESKGNFSLAVCELTEIID